MGMVLLPLLVFLPMLGAGIGYGIGRNNKRAGEYFTWLLTAVIWSMSLSLPENGSFIIEGFCYFGIKLESGGLHKVLAVMTGFVWFLTTVFSKEYFAKEKNINGYSFFMLMTLGATMGVFLSADLYTTFLFFEMMSLTSYVLVLQKGTAEALRGGATYLAVAVLGGLVTLMGIFLLYSKTGTLDFAELRNSMALVENTKEIYVIGGLIAFGFGAKAGMFLLHTWLVQVYTVAPTPATALLSCILSKTGVYGILVLGGIVFFHDSKWGMFLVWMGVLTMLLGGILGIFSIDLKRTLACSSMSQIGFILVGIGMQGVLGHHNALAVDGSLLHLVNHTIIKLLLFLVAGVIFLQTKTLDLNQIRGYGKDKPLLKGIFLMGALGVSGIPLWNGYISKTLLHESIVEEIALLEEAGRSTFVMQSIEYLFLFAGGLTVAYMTKIFVAVFVEQPQKAVCRKTPYMSRITQFLLTFCAILPLLFGLFPHQIQEQIAAMGRSFVGGEAPSHVIHYFSWVNLKGAVISVAIGAIVYFLCIRLVLMKKDAEGKSVYLYRWSSYLDLEEKIYRPVLLQILPFLGALVARTIGSVTDGFIALCQLMIFNHETEKIVPKEDAYFSVYTQGGKEIFKDTLSKSLIYLGIGFAAAMVYLLW